MFVISRPLKEEVVHFSRNNI